MTVSAPVVVIGGGLSGAYRVHPRGVDGHDAAGLAGFDNVWIAGDWIGPRGRLSDAAPASAPDAPANLAQPQRRPMETAS